MSDILENLRCNAAVDDSPAARTCGVSLKVNNAQQASIDAVMDLVENKSYAVRLLLDLGWEAIEEDGVFADVIDKKYEILRVLDFGEDL